MMSVVAVATSFREDSYTRMFTVSDIRLSLSLYEIINVCRRLSSTMICMHMYMYVYVFRETDYGEGGCIYIESMWIVIVHISI